MLKWLMFDNMVIHNCALNADSYLTFMEVREFI